MSIPVCNRGLFESLDIMNLIILVALVVEGNSYKLWLFDHSISMRLSIWLWPFSWHSCYKLKEWYQSKSFLSFPLFLPFQESEFVFSRRWCCLFKRAMLSFQESDTVFSRKQLTVSSRKKFCLFKKAIQESDFVFSESNVFSRKWCCLLKRAILFFLLRKWWSSYQSLTVPSSI